MVQWCAVLFLGILFLSVVEWGSAVHFPEGPDKIFAFIVSALLGDFMNCKISCRKKVQCLFVYEEMNVCLGCNTKSFFIEH